MTDIGARIARRRDEKLQARVRAEREEREGEIASEALFQATFGPVIGEIRGMLIRNAGGRLMQELRLGTALEKVPGQGVRARGANYEYRFVMDIDQVDEVALEIVPRNSLSRGPLSARVGNSLSHGLLSARVELRGTPQEMATAAQDAMAQHAATVAYYSLVDRNAVLAGDSPMGSTAATELVRLLAEARAGRKRKEGQIAAFRTSHRELLSAMSEVTHGLPKEVVMASGTPGKEPDDFDVVTWGESGDGDILVTGAAASTFLEMNAGRVLLTIKPNKEWLGRATCDVTTARYLAVPTSVDIGAADDPQVVAANLEEALIDFMAELAREGLYDPIEVHDEPGRPGLIERLGGKIAGLVGRR